MVIKYEVEMRDSGWVVAALFVYPKPTRVFDSALLTGDRFKIYTRRKVKCWNGSRQLMSYRKW